MRKLYAKVSIIYKIMILLRVMIFTALRVVNKNHQIIFIINKFKFSRESNLEIKKQ